MFNSSLKYLLVLSFLSHLCVIQAMDQARPNLVWPRTALGPADIGIIVNDADELSKKTGDYYRKQRKIPPENLIHIRFKPGQPNMRVDDFRPLKQQVERATPEGVQAYVITWLKPYRVKCMSITSAFAFGFNLDYCAQECKKTKPSPYFNSASHAPFTDYGIRPSMVLAGASFAEVKQLINNGIRSDNTAPSGTAYLVDTDDKSRNVRSLFYDDAIGYMKNMIDVKRVKGDALENKKDVLFYFTGLIRVEGITTNHFLPGAIADHLTSTGGQLTNSKQMSIMEWIRAGATGSYGTVVEPCNLPQKFPLPLIVMDKYTHGETLIEAYWKSVAMPGQGIFVGEPLARPYAGFKIINKDGEAFVRIWSLSAGRYELLGAVSVFGPYHVLGYFNVELREPYDISLDVLNKPFLRVDKVRTLSPTLPYFPN